MNNNIDDKKNTNLDSDPLAAAPEFQQAQVDAASPVNDEGRAEVVAEIGSTPVIAPKTVVRPEPKQEPQADQDSSESEDQASNQTEQDTTPPLLERLLGGDKVLWIIISCLVFMSVLVVYSSTASLAYRTLDGDTSYFLIDQVFNLGLGMAAMFAVYLIHYRYYGRFAEVAFFFALALVIYANFFGETINGASRWLRVPLLGMTFQPSDFLRVALVLLLCKRMNKIGDDFEKAYLLPNFIRRRGEPSNYYIMRKYTLPLLLPIAISCLFIMFANLSTAMITFFTSCAIFYMSRVRTAQVLKLILWTGLAGILMISVMSAFNYGRAETWVNRCKNFVGISTVEVIDEDSDEHYQEEQAQITVASGGLIWGKGPGQSTQRTNLPHSYSDFAYAFIIEEYGDMIAFLVLMFYLWLFARSKLISKKIGSQFPSMLVLGLSLMITFQALINMMVSVGLVPITGQPLPLISKGGSSVIFMGMALGMILSISREAEKKIIEPKKDKKSMVVIRDRVVIS